MERIISYDELPRSQGESIYLRMETDPALYLSLLSKGYRIVNHISNTDDSTIYVTGRRQAIDSIDTKDYKKKFDSKFQGLLQARDIVKPQTFKFSFQDLLEHKYKLPFVLKNEFQNGGREKFLIATEEDYENLILACEFILDKRLLCLSPYEDDDERNQINYQKYLDTGFAVQEYIETPSEYNTSLRVLTSASNDLMCALLKHKLPERITDETTLLGFLLKKIYPLSTKTIVSNTLSGGKNILIGEKEYSTSERELLDSHNIDSKEFNDLIQASKNVHEKCQKELGIICAFDYIYDRNKNKWYLLEYHSRPMVGEYAKRQGLPYVKSNEKLTADGRVRATALSLELKKNR